MSPYCLAHDEWLIMKLCMYVGYYDENNVSNFGGDPETGSSVGKFSNCYARSVKYDGQGSIGLKTRE